MNDIIKVYPHSQEAEEAVLGSIMLEGSSIFEKANAWIRETEAFYYDKNRVLWNIIHEMHRNGEDIDMVTVADKVKNKNKVDESTGLTLYYITGLPEAVPTATNVETYAKIIWEKYIKRESIKSAYKLYNSTFWKSEKYAFVPMILILIIFNSIIFII